MAIAEGMRDVVPPESGDSGRSRRRCAGASRVSATARSHTLAGIRGDVGGGGGRHPAKPAIGSATAGPRAHGADRHDGAGGAPRGYPVRGPAAPPALSLRGAVHPSLGTATQPGRRVRAGRGGAARACAPPARTPRPSPAVRLPGIARHARLSRRAGDRRLLPARSSTPWASTTTARTSSRRLADRDYPLLESIAGNAGVDDAPSGAVEYLELSGTRDGLAQARKMASTAAMDEAIRHLSRSATSSTSPVSRTVVTLDFGLLSGPHVLQRRDLRSVRARRRPADRLRRPLRRPAGALRMGHPRRRFRPRRGPVLDEALEEAGLVPAAAPACIAFAGGLDEPAKAMELRRAGRAVVALPTDAPAPPRPRLHRRVARYVFEPAEGEVVSGSWRDVLRALGIA